MDVTHVIVIHTYIILFVIDELDSFMKLYEKEL